MDNHIKAIHAKIKDYKCPKCYYLATQKAHIVQHTKTVHGLDENALKKAKLKISKVSINVLKCSSKKSK